LPKARTSRGGLGTYLLRNIIVKTEFSETPFPVFPGPEVVDGKVNHLIITIKKILESDWPSPAMI